MIRINLLPIKAAKRRGSVQTELIVVGGILLTVLMGLFVWNFAVSGRMDEMDGQIKAVEKQIAERKKEVVRVEGFKQKTELLERKLAVIENLKKQKIGPSRLLSDLADILTEEKKVWLTRLEEKNGVLSLEGGAIDNEDISSFQLALQRRSKFISDVQLNGVSSAKQDSTAFVKWRITCKANYTAG